MDKNTRRAKVLINDQWEDINPMDIKKDMVFKLFELDGTPVLYRNRGDIFEAVCDSYLNKEGICCMQVKNL